MPQFDMDEVLTLLSIPEKVASVTGGRLSHITAEAMSRLERIEMGLMNAKREQQNLPPVPDPMVEGARTGPQTGAESETVSNPTPSEPVDMPKSEVAKRPVPEPGPLVPPGPEPDAEPELEPGTIKPDLTVTPRRPV